MAKVSDLKGQRFGLLKVIKEAGRDKNRKAKWLCQCECGNTKTVIGSNLKKGKTTSCGCVHKKQLADRNATHGLSNHPLFKRWSNMNNRCNNPNEESYLNYGAKGVYVCPRWHRNNPDGLQNFIDDVYPSYLEALKTIPNPQLDKDILAIPNQPKCYSKDTCCWVTPSENCKARNT